MSPRRVLRDISERGRDLENVLHQYTTLVKPAFEEFCIPTKKYADVIIPRGAENVVALDLIKQHIEVNVTTLLLRFLMEEFCNGPINSRVLYPLKVEVSTKIIGKC